MKANIHPEVKDATVTCACGATFKTKSTKENPPVIAEAKTDKAQEDTKPEVKVQYDESVNENIDKIDNYFNKE